MTLKTGQKNTMMEGQWCGKTVHLLAVRMQREKMSALVTFVLFPLLFHLGPKPRNNATTFRMGIDPLILYRNALPAMID
jgi:hypothetical protein